LQCQIELLFLSLMSQQNVLYKITEPEQLVLDFPLIRGSSHQGRAADFCEAFGSLF